MTQLNFENLNKLADFLETLPEEKFDLSQYRKDKKDDVYEAEFKSMTDCGTVGCAIGWAPFIEGLEPKEEEFKHAWHAPEIGKVLDYAGYSERVFGATFSHLTYDPDSEAMNFMFSAKWTRYFDFDSDPLENTPKATADRVRIVTSGLFDLSPIEED